jgi:hypothetical protein
MSSIPFHGNWYSDIIVYDERLKYYYMWARKNRPLLDDEVRNMNLEIVDQIRRSMQKTYGTVGSPTEVYSNSSETGANNSFEIIQSATDIDNNFTIIGGAGIENPAVLFAKGFYIFLTGSIDYNQQGVSGAITDPTYTETNIPSLTTPTSERVDVVYIDLHFSEASAVEGPNQSEYTDTNLRNPIIGTETANRARAVFDIRVWENWRFSNADGSPRTSPCPQINENIFTSTDFLGAIDAAMVSDPNPMDKHYLIPIAILDRPALQSEIYSSNILNLLDLYNKRTLNLSEITYRINHGGFTQNDVNEVNLMTTYPGLTGLVVARYPDAKVDESAYATGANEGIGTESFNTGSVTPRVLDNTGKFAVGGILIGRETGTSLYPVTGPESLCPGELVAKDISAKSIYVGYDRTVTGVRQYLDRVNINMQGMTGNAGLNIINTTGATGTSCLTITTNETGGNFISVDYEGRLGIDTNVPGWSGPDVDWQTTTRFTGTSDVVDIVLDVNASTRTTQHAFVDKDIYIKRDSYGLSWKIPGLIGSNCPVVFGVTGVPKYGLTGSPASLQVVPGIAVMGATGVLKGYTGNYGFYEAYDANGARLYTIGSEGDPYDRQVLSLYGTSERAVFEASFTDSSNDTYAINFYNFPTDLSINPVFYSTPLEVGDVINYGITLEDEPGLTGSTTVTCGGYTGLYEVASYINSPTGLGFYRIFAATGALTRPGSPPGSPPYTGPITYFGYTGTAIGAAVTDDGNYLRFLLKSMPEINLTVENLTMDIQRAGVSGVYNLPIGSIPSGFFGSGLYGGDIVDLRFVKFDLGEGADAFMFNGDVYFNGGGVLNKVTFSPTAMFRDNVYVYGTLFSDMLMIQLAQFINLQVSRDIQVNEYISVVDGLAVGFGPTAVGGINALQTLSGTLLDTQYNILELVQGGIRANNLNLYFGQQSDYSDFGIKWDLAWYQNQANVTVYVLMNGGTIYDSTKPFGIHIIDNRQITEGFYNTFVIEGSDNYGSPPTYFDVLLWVKGDLQVGTTDLGSSGNICAKSITLGTGLSQDTQYVLSLKSGTAFIDSLTVNSIQYSATNPTSAAFFTNPQNIIVVQPTVGDVSFNKTQGILRTKEFSFDTYTNPPAVLSNLPALGGISQTDPNNNDYHSIAISTPSSGSGARWANDTLSFTEEQVSTYSASGTDIVTTDFNTPANKNNFLLYRDNFNRIIVANFGTLDIKWYGYSNIPTTPDDIVDYPFVNGARQIPISILTLSNQIISYTFTSSLFKADQSGNNTFDWQSPTNNFVTSVKAAFNDNNFSTNSLFILNKMLGICIPFDGWWVHETQTGSFYERVLYYPFVSSRNTSSSIVLNSPNNFNVVPFDQQYEGGPDMWEMAIYPRIVEQKVYNITTQNLNVSSPNSIYEGIWNVDVVIYPTTSGSLNNLVGNLLISYM